MRINSKVERGVVLLNNYENGEKSAQEALYLINKMADLFATEKVVTIQDELEEK